MSRAHVASVVTCALAFVFAACRLDSTPPAITFQSDTAAADFGVVEVSGLHRDALIALDQARPTIDQWNRILGVYAGSATPQDSTLAVLGTYEVRRDRLRFTPRFRPMPGQSYRVRFNGPALPIPVSGAVVDTTIELPRVTSFESARVQAVYPSAEHVPMNLLRLYVHFSAPMSTGSAYQRMRVLDESGNKVEDAFLVIANEQELWDPEHRRLTMLFDPGRIKRNLRPHEEVGLPLREGRTYTLEIDSTWADANGNPMASTYRKRFSVGPADRALPRTTDWRITAPRAGGTTPLIVNFPESLDHALLLRLLVVRTAGGDVIPGQPTVGPNEQTWSFIPEKPWGPGDYVIEVNTDLEDLAGNNLRDVFDVDRNAAGQRATSAERINLPFTVR